MGKVRATRHNGRSGKAGIFKAGHNDRTFDLENAGHIDSERSDQNVYWDCFQGYNLADKNGVRPERKYCFEEIEYAYYLTRFGDSIEAQNERHRQQRHANRIRSVGDILKDPRTCPEESIYQLGTKDGHEDPKLFSRVVDELMAEIKKRYGSNIQVLDWALHMDEETPHIHERHVFFADDGYGMNFPKQDKACEALGFERPDPEKKQSKYNNRKMSFDAEIRRLYIEIAEKHGVTIEKIPLEGKVHLEKNDFIIARQNEEIAEKEAKLSELNLKISDIDEMVEEVAEIAYEKACEVVTETVKEETIKEDIDIVSDYQEWITAPERKMSDDQRNLVRKVLDIVMKRLARNTAALLAKVKGILSRPEVKKKNMEKITGTAKESIREKLARNKQVSAQQDQTKQNIKKDKDKEVR